MKKRNTVLALYMSQRKPIAVKVKPIMIESSTRPHFIMFPVHRISHRGKPLMHVGPIAMPVTTIGIIIRIYMNYGLP